MRKYILWTSILIILCAVGFAMYSLYTKQRTELILYLADVNQAFIDYTTIEELKAQATGARAANERTKEKELLNRSLELALKLQQQFAEVPVTSHFLQKLHHGLKEFTVSNYHLAAYQVQLLADLEKLGQISPEKMQQFDQLTRENQASTMAAYRLLRTYARRYHIELNVHLTNLP